MQLLQSTCPPARQARLGGSDHSALRSLSSHVSLTKQTRRPALAWVPAPVQQLCHSSLVVYGTKEGLDAELEATQKTLDKVLQAVQAAQAAQQQQQSAVIGSEPQSSYLFSREQQLWDRQQEMMDRMQQQWDAERQAFMAREQQLLSELSQLRQELSQLLLRQASTAAAAAPAQPAGGAQIAVASAQSLTETVEDSSGSASASVTAAAAAASSAASWPGMSMQAGQAVISGPSSASAAVAAAIRAVRDEGLTRTPSASSDGGESADGGAWQDLFSSSGQRGASSVTSALAAVDTTDVLEGIEEVSFSSSRGRRRLAGSNGSSSGSNGNGSSASSTLQETDSMTGASGSSTVSTGSSAGTGDSSASSSALPIEVQKGDPEGPPPILTVGDDDIYWVSKLHDGLQTAGFYPVDEEVENWLFAESTQNALLTFQACNSIAETGVTCEDTWKALMGEAAYEAAYGHLSRRGSNGSSSSSSSSNSSEGVETHEAASGEVVYSFGGSSSSSSDTASSSSSTLDTAGSISSSGSSSGARRSGTGWPVVMDMDGGREVHALQVCLQKAGFSCGDDEMRWWQFGSSTLDALKTFQACSGLPESGVCDERTWVALLGTGATPEDLEEVRGDESMYEDDMSAPHEGAVWLVGEQRWSKPSA